MRRVVVTGVGLVTPLGVGVEANWRRLLAGECGVRRLEALAALPSHLAATVPEGDGPEEFSAARCALLGRGEEGSTARFIQYALSAADEALTSAGWAPATDAEREATGVAIGSGIGSLRDIVDAADTLRERGHRRISPHFVPKMLVNMAAGHVSIRAGLRGPTAAPSTACATGAHALADGLRMIRSGEADVILAGGAESAVEPLAVAGFCRLRALSTGFNDEPALASRPFDARRDGFVIGEGAAVLTLESLDHATARGATPLAEIASVGLSSDAHHVTAPADGGEGALRAMRLALAAGGISADELGYVNAHATSTPLGDAAEARAIDALCATRSQRAPPLYVSSTKGATGHLLGAAGAVEAAYTVLSIARAALPPTINLDEPEPAPMSFEHVRTGDTPAAPRAALCNSFGFGGMNASVLFTAVRDDG